jgi:DNA primase
VLLGIEGPPLGAKIGHLSQKEHGFLFSVVVEARGGTTMAAIDYRGLRQLVTIEQVLTLAAFEACESTGPQVRGPCPIHRSSSPTSRSFSANLAKHTFQCFKCGQRGNQLDLWMAITKLPIHDAASDHCKRLGIEPPKLKRN